MNLDRAFPGQQEFWQGKDFDILKYGSLSLVILRPRVTKAY